MDDGCVLPLAKTIPSDGILSWMIEIWMEKHLVGDSICKNVQKYTKMNIPTCLKKYKSKCPHIWNNMCEHVMNM